MEFSLLGFFNGFFYYRENSVLVENRPFLKVHTMRKDIQEAIQDSNGLFFPISSLVRISMTSFLAFILFFFVQKHSCLYNEKKVRRRLKIQILFSCVRKQYMYFYLLAVLFRKLLFLPLENKTHIFALALLW